MGNPDRRVGAHTNKCASPNGHANTDSDTSADANIGSDSNAHSSAIADPGTSGHAEVVEVEYDASRVSFEELLDVFWGCHNPTTPNRQGPDVGTQYRSAVFCRTPEQEATALASQEKLAASGRLAAPIVTEIQPAPAFYRAEEYHQRYFEKQGKDSCSI